jgi:hypothetical protein
MRYTVHKWFFAWDFEKEEKWLNEMSAKGLQLVSVGFCKYLFEEADRGEYMYRLELLDYLPSNAESIAYIRFLEETGIEYIGSVLRWAYFRKKAADGVFEIYSDVNSKIKHCKRIMALFFAVIPVNLFSLIANIDNSIQYKHPVNYVITAILILLILLLGFGILKVLIKITKLKRERAIKE